MQWESVEAFVGMGGYAFYVWGSFGLTLMAMLVEVMQLRRRARLLQEESEAMQ